MPEAPQMECDGDTDCIIYDSELWKRRSKNWMKNFPGLKTLSGKIHHLNDQIWSQEGVFRSFPPVQK